jgi:hypothetical protein
MLLDSHSIGFKIAMVVIWILPYLALAILTRDWFEWIKKLYWSTASAVLFSCSLILFMLLFADFDPVTRMNWPIMKVLLRSLFFIVIYVPGLVVIVLMSLPMMAFRPSDQKIGCLAAISTPFHVLYFVNILMRVVE